MSGEVRFTQESGHRVPHDPLIGLDRSVELLEQVIDGALPFSNEEAAAFFLMGNTLSRRGNFREAIGYYDQALQRNVTMDQKLAALREMGASYYRLSEFEEAARKFYEAMQWRMNAVDQYLFRVALDQMKGPKPPLPTSAIFPLEETAADSASVAALGFEDIARTAGIQKLNGNGTCAW